VLLLFAKTAILPALKHGPTHKSYNSSKAANRQLVKQARGV